MTSSSPRDVRATMAGASSTCCGAEGERAGGVSLPPPATLADLQARWPAAYALLVDALQKLGIAEAELRAERAMNERYRAVAGGYRELLGGDGVAGSA